MWLLDVYDAYNNWKEIFFTSEDALLVHLARIDRGELKVDNIAWIRKTYPEVSHVQHVT